MQENLKKKTVSGMIWSALQRFGTMGISFVSNIVLARLLTPDDYGTIGMLMIFIALANTFIDGGFGSALIQKKEPTQKDYSTIFWWNMLLSILLYGILYLSAPAIANFYNLPLLSDVLRVQGLVLIINALSIIQQNQLRKQLKFKRLSFVTLVSVILSTGIAIVLAYMGWGVWTLVAQQLMSSGFTAIQLWMLNKWYPLLSFSKKSFKELFGFGGFMFASTLINSLFNNVQGLLIGKFFTPATLGYYTQAKKLEDVASTSLTTIVDQVSYPVLAQFQDDRQKLISLLKKLILLIAFVSFPLMILLIIVSHPLISFIYSEKWLPCVPYFNILCLAGIAMSLQGINHYAVASVGKSKAMFLGTIVKRCFTILYLLIGIGVGDSIYGLLWAMVANSWTILIINAYLTSKYVGYKLKQQITDLLPTIALVIFSYIISRFAVIYIELDVSLTALIQAVSFMCIYIVLAKLFKIDAYAQIKEIIVNYIKKMQSRK